MSEANRPRTIEIGRANASVSTLLVAGLLIVPALGAGIGAASHVPDEVGETCRLVLSDTVCENATQEPPGTPQVHTPVETPFNRTHGRGIWSDSVATEDGGVVLVGRYRDTSGDMDAWVTKVGPTGHPLFNETYGTDGGHDAAKSVVLHDDGRFVVGGEKGNHDTWLAKFAPNGSTIWSRTYASGAVKGMAKTCTGGYALAGGRNSGDGFNGGLADEKFMIVDADGDVVVSKSDFLDRNDRDRVRGVARTEDCGFLLAGVTGFRCPSKGWLVKMSDDGEVEWDRTYRPERDLFDIERTPDGDYAFVGRAGHRHCPGGNTAMSFRKVDPDGNTQVSTVMDWTPQREFARDLAVAVDGGYALTGATRGGGSWDLAFAKLAPNGSVKSTAVHGGGGNDRGRAIIQTGYGASAEASEGPLSGSASVHAAADFAVAGFTTSFGGDGLDGWFLRGATCPSGTDDCLHADH